ncbi:hypothetical protein SAMN05880593_11890 [Rhizobium sp. RU36D]|nr:hypothetical protein SAMN05880593_11890 [Rhizobium sp. RU36D]
MGYLVISFASVVFVVLRFAHNGKKINNFLTVANFGCDYG